MRQTLDNLLIALLSLFLVASFCLVAGIARQAQALEMGAAFAQGPLVHEDKVRIALSRIDDIGQYKKASATLISGRAGVLRGIAGLLVILHTNISHLSLGLFVCLSGLLVVGLAMYLRLRSYAKQLALTGNRAAI